MFAIKKARGRGKEGGEEAAALSLRGKEREDLRGKEREDAKEEVSRAEPREMTRVCGCWFQTHEQDFVRESKKHFDAAARMKEKQLKLFSKTK